MNEIVQVMPVDAFLFGVCFGGFPSLMIGYLWGMMKTKDEEDIIGKSIKDAVSKEVKKCTATE